MSETEIQPSPFNDGDEVQDEDGDEIIEEEIDDEELEADGDIEEDDDEDLEADGDDLSDEELDEIIDGIEDDVEDEQVATVPHAALHQERMKRKELQSNLHDVQAREAEMQGAIEGYEQQLSDIRNKLKDFGLEDEFDLKEPEKVSDEVLEMRQQKQHQALESQMGDTINSLREEAADYIMDYPELDGESPAQAELVMGLALSAHILGAEREDAIQHALQLVNGIVIDKKKEARRSARPRKKAVGTRTRASKAPRNTREFFDNMASSIGE